MRRTLMFLGALILAVATVRQAPAAMAAPLTGTPITIANGPGDQFDPHVSGDWVSYTDFSVTPSRIRYHNLATGQDAAVPDLNGGQDVVSGITGTTIVYMHITNGGQAIDRYDIGSSAPTELSPVPNEIRADPAIGGRTVAFEDSTSYPSGANIVAYSLDTGNAVFVTNDAFLNVNPGVSPDGHVIVWTKCISSTVCHVWQATLSNGAWTAQQLTSGSGVELQPHTDGHIVVYEARRGGTSEVCWQPVGGGAETQITSGPGDARNAHVSDGLVSYEQRGTSASNTSWDVYVYSLATGVTYAVTSTSNLDEVLSDISVGPDGMVRTVWAVNEPANGYNVYGLISPVPVPTESLTVRTSGLPAGPATISNGGVTLGVASDAAPLTLSLPTGTALSLHASGLVMGTDGSARFFQRFDPAPPASLNAPFATTAVYLTLADVVGGGLSDGGIYGPGAHGIATSLSQQWAAVQADIQAGNTAQALADIQSFACHVNAQIGQHITSTLGSMLLDDAALTYKALGGGSLPAC